MYKGGGVSECFAYPVIMAVGVYTLLRLLCNTCIICHGLYR